MFSISFTGDISSCGRYIAQLSKTKIDKKLTLPYYFSSKTSILTDILIHWLIYHYTDRYYIGPPWNLGSTWELTIVFNTGLKYLIAKFLLNCRDLVGNCIHYHFGSFICSMYRIGYYELVLFVYHILNNYLFRRNYHSN